MGVTSSSCNLLGTTSTANARAQLSKLSTPFTVNHTIPLPYSCDALRLKSSMVHTEGGSLIAGRQGVK